MTSTTFFTGSAPAAKGPSSAVRPLARKPQASTQARSSTAYAAARAAYPWMTQALFGNLSARAQRLMRADY